MTDDTLLDALTRGSAGVRLRQTGEREVLDARPGYARWFEPELSVTFMARHSPFALVLDDPREPSLRRNLEVDARRAFVREYQRLAAEPSAGVRSSGPRTDDAQWSPIIEADVVAVPGGRVLRCIHRRSYQPSHEGIWASMRCPVSDGVVVLDALTLSRETGLRESVLMLRLPKREHPGQAYFDAPEHDASFPEHGLSRLRRAVAAWLDPSAGALEITRPSEHAAAGVEVELPGSESAIVPAAGFQLLPPAELSMAPSLSTFTRVGLDTSAPSLLDVWRLPVEPSPRNADELTSLAEQVYGNWAHEGAADIRVHTERRPSTHTAELRTVVHFTVRGEPKLNIGHWWLCNDGVVFRVGLSIEPPWTVDEWRPAFDEVVYSWRRLAGPSRARSA